MASSTLFRLSVLVYMLSFLSSSFSLIPNEKVKLDLYYETLSPDCSDFIVHELLEIVSNGLIDIHGEYECKLNMVEACVIQALPDVTMHTLFIHCMQMYVSGNKTTEWESCYQLFRIDPKPITDCTNSSLGKQLELRYANETASLEPPHNIVPWVVVNNEPLGENFHKFVSFICKAYNGTPPDACKHISPRVPRFEPHKISRFPTLSG
ncbi:hypothetical protein ACHQM5_016960 [Ranunculus cassubicifolius]